MLSTDRLEFRRVCDLELNKAAVLAGAFDKLATTDQVDQAKKRLFAIAQDMAESLPARIPHDRVPELFRVARAHYARVPGLHDLQRAWDNHMKPQAEAPAPKDAPKLAPPPELDRSEAQMRHLAAVRTSLAEGGQMRVSATRGKKASTAELCSPLQAEEWMHPLLALDPSRAEVEAMTRACTSSSLAWYVANPAIPPCWGGWIAFYGIGARNSEEEGDDF